MGHVARQRGAALLMSLVILLVLTLLAVSGMQGSVMQERMATAQREGVIALEAAEAGLRQAEQVLDGLTDLTDFGSTNGFYLATDTDLPSPYAAATWDPSGTSSAAGTAVNGLTPRFYFEYKGEVTLNALDELPRNLAGGLPQTDVTMHAARVVVMGPSPSGEGRRIIESFYVFDPS